MLGIDAEEEYRGVLRAARIYVWALVAGQVVALTSVGIVAWLLWRLMAELHVMLP